MSCRWNLLSIGLAVAVAVVAVSRAGVAQAPPAGPWAKAGDVQTLRAPGAEVAIGGSPGSYVAACSQCHGLDGSGDEAGAFPRLAGQSGWYLYKSLADYRSGLRPHPVMSPIATTLDDAQMRAVASFYAALDGATPAAPRMADVELLQTGGAIAAVGVVRDGIPACSSCHGPAGSGGAPTVPSIAGQPASYLEYQLHAWKTGRRSGDPLGVMSAIARAMSDGQIRAASAYFAASPAPARAGSLGTSPPATSSISPPPGPAGDSPPYLTAPTDDRTAR